MSERPLPRLFLDHPLAKDQSIALPREAAHYLVKVLRLKAGDGFLGFNGIDGEWRLEMVELGKAAKAQAIELNRKQSPKPDLHYLFAPIKGARLDYIGQKAVEMGAGHLQPVITDRTVVRRVNLERLRKNTIEAAEQCLILSLPTMAEPQSLSAILSTWPENRKLIFCDEHAEPCSARHALQEICREPLAVLIGPEGGFTSAERAQILALKAAVPISLGPRILRADTAAVAALALIEAFHD